MRWHSGRLFVKLTAANCPPLTTFVDKTDTKFSDRRKLVHKWGWYCETISESVVVEWDVLIFLLEIRNKKVGCRCSPTQKHADEEELHRWICWARQLPHLLTAEDLGCDSEAPNESDLQIEHSEQAEIGQSNRNKNKSRLKLSNRTRLETVAQKVLRNAKLTTEDAKVKALSELMVECQQEGMTYSLDQWGKQISDPDRRLPLHLLTGITNQSAKRIRALQSGLSQSEAKEEKRRRGAERKRKIPRRFHKLL